MTLTITDTFLLVVPSCIVAWELLLDSILMKLLGPPCFSPSLKNEIPVLPIVQYLISFISQLVLVL